ncbi:type I restriction endonuclease [Thermococcus sp. LS1]|uniref:type I restriction endonuclease n=1 Tax=Thermococcus sp. LS1 TaxID=1638259 RepID=UPI00143BFF66
MDLLEIIERVKKISGKIPNEESTKQHLILPILMALGWDVFDPDEVMPETSTEEGRPDYAIMINGRIVAFLEAKSVKERIFRDGRINSKHARQLAGYCFDKGIRIGILTNGLQWALINAFEEYKPVDERIILAVDLMNQSTEEAIERLRWFSKEKITNYRDIPSEYSRIPTQVSVPVIQKPILQRLPSAQDHNFRTLYVSAREVQLPPSAVAVEELIGRDLRGYTPTAVFVQINGKWYRVEISHGKRWRGLKLTWSSITSVVVRFLLDMGVKDFPVIGKYLSKAPTVSQKYWNAVAKIGNWYLYLPEDGNRAVAVFHELAKATGVNIALEVKRNAK